MQELSAVVCFRPEKRGTARFGWKQCFSMSNAPERKLLLYRKIFFRTCALSEPISFTALRIQPVASTKMP